MRLRRLLCAGLLAAGAACASAEGVGDRLQRLLGRTPATDEILDPESAFRLHAEAAGPASARFLWDIEDGYYLYRDRFSFTVSNGTARVDAAQLVVPRGEWKEDEVFGSVEVNTGAVEVVVPLTRTPGPELPVTLTVGYQGCKDKAVCYPPIRKDLTLTLAAWSGAGTASADAPLSESDAITARLRDSGFLANVLAFLGFGLLLSLTPCVFPLIPILSGIVTGRGTDLTPRTGFGLSLAYVLALAAAYAVLGVVAGSLQINLQTASQVPAVLVTFSLVFVVLAMSMFGLFELQVPAALQSRLAALSDAQRGGTYRGAAVMGALSAIIAGPCVAPPLAGALLYISQTGDAPLGGAALFAMGLGFGAPLLLLGISAGSLLPRAGRWMGEVRRVFGIVMLGVAVWLLGRVLPGPVTLVLWALLLIGTAAYLGALDRFRPEGGAARFFRAAGFALLVWGALLIVGAAGGNDDPLRPLAGFRAEGVRAGSGRLPFQRVEDLPALELQLRNAALENRLVMLDFYADWCVECKRMERNTFPDPRVRDRLRDVVLLQADVTANDPASLELLAAYELFGPPAILFFRPGGELRAHRLIGYLSAEEFLRHLAGVLHERA
jgi:thiol:disulfide interchange protein DsbD